MISNSMLPFQYEVLSKELGRIISGQLNHGVLDVLMNGAAIQKSLSSEATLKCLFPVLSKMGSIVKLMLSI